MDSIASYSLFASLIIVWMFLIVPWLGLSWTSGSLIIFAAIAIFEYIRSRSSLFRYLRIKGPPATFFVGSLLDINKGGQPHKVLHRWSRRYGKVYGYYNGGIPTLSICDYKFADEVLTECSHCFMKASQHTSSEAGSAVSSKEEAAHKKRQSLFLSIALAKFDKDELTSMLAEMMVGGFRTLKDKADEKLLFDVTKCYKQLIVDPILQVAVGNRSSAWLKDQLLGRDSLFKEEFTLLHLPKLLPELNFLWRPIGKTLARWNGGDLLSDIKSALITEIVTKRTKLDMEKQTEHSIALIDLLEGTALNNQQYQELEASLGKICGSSDNVTSNDIFLKNRKLFEEEIALLSTTIILHSTVTIPKALSVISYTLAQYPAVQKRLQHEVDSVFAGDRKNRSLYAAISELPLLENVVNECLRMYPVGECLVNQVCTLTCGTDEFPIPAGLTAQMNIWSIHHDPDIWGPDAGKFIPERWNNETCCPTEAFQPFGVGIDQVIGTQLSMDIIKVIMVHILHRFTFESGSNILTPLKLQCKSHLEPARKVCLRVKARKGNR